MSASALALLLLLAGPNAKAADDLIVVVPEGAAKPAVLSGQVDRWRQELGAGNVVWVDSVKRDKPSGFGSMAVLNFADEARRAAWEKANAASLAAPLEVVRADVLTEGGAVPAAGSKPVYKISYYELTAPRADFQAWVDGYLAKYLQAQLRHGILTRYAMYLEHGQGGRALLVLEYADARTEQGAEPIKEKLSEDIARADAEYTRQSRLKETLRTTQSWTLAVPAR
ncbi:hypothetical protein B1992_12630 [Pseudoxanthomonas broegbernensis]|uniref:Uncharacterized protein n=1 Tax=Pseudoxanthomonas broegbernensis TaxID=83619 RepID=A0A7V8GKV6_9GAMM|nr:hypothetical protein [Pseudoxanthomonas broegbernensis]KAF1685371.1 hypothetical protein B1992_12630 [Pseudoxanthomonas broegbernensis]MBB6066421.1 hypothetical protein [Pseudoxanthomonas broegbernensis]